VAAPMAAVAVPKAAAAAAAEAPRPELIYLPRPSMLNSADTWVVASCGTMLPAHSQVLQLASPVLEEAFAVKWEAGGSGSSMGGGGQVRGCRQRASRYLCFALVHSKVTTVN